MSVPRGYVRHARTHTLYREDTWSRLVTDGRVQDADGLRYVEPVPVTAEDRRQGRMALATLLAAAGALAPGGGIRAVRP